MTEPVAYRVDGTFYNNLHDAEYAVREINHLRNTLKIDNGLIPKIVYIEPLYEEEQLHPRVKMTSEQRDEFLVIKNNSVTFSDFWTQVFKQGMVRPSISKLSEHDLMTAWLDEETIDIVPDMKWFVRSKEKHDGVYIILANTNPIFVDDLYGVAEDDEEIAFKAPQFDTKDEAELWTNPLTEAV